MGKRQYKRKNYTRKKIYIKKRTKWGENLTKNEKQRGYIQKRDIY